MLHVEKMSFSDFGFAVRLTDTMNWNMVERDFELAVQLEPEGCFVLLSDQERIGIATSIAYGRIGWLGNVIVNESYREKGGGSLLVKEAIQYLKTKGVESIGLYAYPERTPFYTRIGFRHDSDFKVLKGRGFATPVKSHLREVARNEIRQITDLDAKCFGGPRRKLLEPIILDSNNLCLVSVDNDLITGFVAAKVYHEVAEIGPLVCGRARKDAASDLLEATLNRLGTREVSLCIPSKDSDTVNFLAKHGFAETFRVARMFWGKPIHSDCIYAAESLERG